MTTKDTYFIRLVDSDTGRVVGVGECPLFAGLSAEDTPDYPALLDYACHHPEQALSLPYSSIRFGFESAMRLRPDTSWTRGEAGIPINGLIWMGDKNTMATRIRQKLDQGFRVLKLKIGGIRFDDEVDLLRHLRWTFRPDDLEIRLDANGSFPPADALGRLDTLARYHIHSLEQPVRAGQPEVMADICRRSPIAIALDEELIGCRTPEASRSLLADIAPHYIILKPALCGGFAAADVYIAAATGLGIGWWATSALESDIGLEAIAGWLSTHTTDMPQGLGTGQLYRNNIPSPLELRGSSLWRRPDIPTSTLDTLPWT